MIKLITLLVSLSLIGFIESNPVPEDPSVDWSTRISDNVDSLIGPTKFNFDDSSEEIDSTFAKREASPISGPLDAPLGWGARIESLPSSVGGDISPSSSSSGTGAVVTGASAAAAAGSVGVIGGDNKQKVDWALNPGDNKKLYSSNDTPDVIEQKKEETLPLAPESSKPSEESNPDPYKNILPAVLTGKRRLAEGDKPVQSSPSSSPSSSTSSLPSSVPSEGYASPSSVNDPKEKVFSLVDGKGHSSGQVLPYDGPYHLKPNEAKSIPQHVYTEDQFPSVITIKGREYLVIPHKSNTVRPSAAQSSPGSPWYSIPVQGQFVQSGQFGSQFFNPNSPTAPYQPTQAGHESKSNQSSPPVAQSTVPEVPSGGHHHQFVSSPFTGGYPGQSSYEFGHPSFPQHPGSSRFTWSSRYPVYHSSVFTNSNVQQSGPSAGQFSENSTPSVFSSFFPQYGQYPSSSSSPVIKNFEFFTPPSHTVSISSTGSSSSSSGSSVAASPQGEVKDNPTFVPDPSFSPKLQDSFQSSPSVVGNGGGSGGGGGVIINTQQESFVTKQPIKPESNLHAPPQIPTWSPFGFSVVAGSYPIQSPSPSVSVSTSSSSSVSSSSPSSPTLSSSSSSSSSKTHAESPVKVTVDTKFPPPRSPSSSSSSFGNNGVKGGSPSVESSSPSITVGSFNVDSAADQPVAKGQPQPPKPQQTQQQDQQQVGIAGETLVPTTMLHAKNQFLPNNPFLSSSGYFVSSPPVNQSPTSVYSTSSTSVSQSPPTPDSIPQLGGFPDQRHFLTQPWHPSSSSSSNYNYPIPASSPSPYFDPVDPVPTPSWDYPFYHQFQQENFYNQRSGGLDQPDFDLNQVPSAKIFRSPAFAN